MRLKIVLLLLVLGFLAAAALLLSFFGWHSASQPQKIEQTSIPAEPTSSSKPQNTPETAAETAAPVIENHQAYVEQRVAELSDLGAQDDTASLDAILSELTNRDPDIRKAALDAAIQFGSRDAIPKLTEAASQTDDVHEKTALYNAIEFLQLPSVSELQTNQGPVVPRQPGARSAPRRKAFGQSAGTTAP